MSASRGADDREAFIKACADGNTRRVRRLLDQGADVEAAVDGQPSSTARLRTACRRDLLLYSARASEDLQLI